MTAWGVYFGAAAATASHARISANITAFARFYRCSSKDSYASLGPGELIWRVISSIPSTTLRKCQGIQMKTWSKTIKKDLGLHRGSRVYGLRRLNWKWPSICIEMAQDRRVWSATMRDAINALEAGKLRSGWSPLQWVTEIPPPPST